VPVPFRPPLEREIGRAHVSIADLEILATTQREIIDDLKPEDYCSGPEPDEKYPWKVVVVFGKKYRGIELYIKFSIGEAKERVVCLSFHQAEKQMRYPFK
jgi:hypothetical protein